MARKNNYPHGPVTVYSESTTASFHPATGWIEASQITKIQAVFEALKRLGLCEVSAAYQTANDVDSADTPVAIGSYRSSNGIDYPSDWTTVSLGGKQWIRFGFLSKLTSGSTLGLFYVLGTFYTLEG